MDHHQQTDLHQPRTCKTTTHSAGHLSLLCTNKYYNKSTNGVLILSAFRCRTFASPDRHLLPSHDYLYPNPDPRYEAYAGRKRLSGSELSGGRQSGHLGTYRSHKQHASTSVQWAKHATGREKRLEYIIVSGPKLMRKFGQFPGDDVQLVQEYTEHTIVIRAIE